MSVESLERINEDIHGVKARAGFFLSKRRKDLDLYCLLADTMAVCERVDVAGLLDQMRLAVEGQDRAGRNRAYTEKSADVYLVVGRAVFEPEINRAACWRYSATLREAAKRQIRSSELAGWLRENGGVNALFRRRPVAARTALTKTLHLNEQIEVPKDGDFTLVLRRRGDGFFDVVRWPE